MKLTLKFLPICLFLFLEMLGCKSVQPSDLPGTWVIKDGLRTGLPPELHKGSPKIVFNANGTFVATDMPALLYFPGLYAARLESGSGTWRFRPVDGEQRVQLDFQSIKDWKHGIPFGTDLEISSESLYYDLDDPDLGRRVYLEKKK